MKSIRKYSLRRIRRRIKNEEKQGLRQIEKKNKTQDKFEIEHR